MSESVNNPDSPDSPDYPNPCKVLFKRVTGGYTWSIWSNGQDREQVLNAIQIAVEANRRMEDEFGSRPPSLRSLDRGH